MLSVGFRYTVREILRPLRDILRVITAIQLRKEISNEWALIISGIMSILLGEVLMASLAAGALAMIWVIGAYALIFNLMVVQAFRLRGIWVNSS